MKVNEVLKLKATDLNFNGYGVARHNNVVVFVPYLLKDEEADVKLISVKKNYCFGKSKSLRKSLLIELNLFVSITMNVVDVPYFI